MKQNILKFIFIALLIAALIVCGVMLVRLFYNNAKEPSKPSDTPPMPSNTGTTAPPHEEPTEPVHFHSFNEARVEDIYMASSATCLSPATYYYICACGEIGADTYEDGTIVAHTMVNGSCVICHRSESTGFIFTPNHYDEQDPNSIRTCTLSGFGTCSDADLIIPSLSPDGMIVTHIGDAVFEGNEVIESLTLSPTLKKIGNNAFKNASALRKVYFAADGSLTIIGTDAFANCDALEAITLPEGLTHLGNGAFFDCNYLSAINLPSTLETISDSAFAQCVSLLDLTLTEGVKTVGNNAFGSCYSLSNIDLPDTLEVIDSLAFANSLITEVTIPASVREIHKDAFLGCNNLATISVHPDNTTYYSIDGALYRRSDNALIIYPHSNKTENLVLPEGMTTILADTFLDHQNLISVSIPASITKIEDGAFFGCSQLEIVTIPDGSALTEIGKRAFSHCKNLKSIDIPDGVTVISSGAFESCTSLSKVTIPYGVTTFESYSFNGCESLQTIDIPDTVTAIEAFAFQWTGLKSVTIPKNVRSCEGAFIYSQQLTSIKVASDNPYYKSVDGILYSIDGKNLVAYPAGKTDKTFAVPYGVESIGSFDYCNALESVYIPASVCALGSFTHCTNLKTVTFAKNCQFTYLYGNFKGCTSLTSFVIPKSVTHIDIWTFDNCTNLTSVTIPDSVIQISGGAFRNCQGLSSIIFEGSIEQWNSIAFVYDWDENTGDYTVHCTDGVIAKQSIS